VTIAWRLLTLRRPPFSVAVTCSFSASPSSEARDPEMQARWPARNLISALRPNAGPFDIISYRRSLSWARVLVADAEGGEGAPADQKELRLDGRLRSLLSGAAWPRHFSAYNNTRRNEHEALEPILRRLVAIERALGLREKIEAPRANWRRPLGH
jgi:hypothetical protein